MSAMDGLTLVAVRGVPEILPGMDLAGCLAPLIAPERAVASDVLVIAQKIVSKAEGRLEELDRVTPGERARELAGITRKDPRLVELILRESTEVVRAKPDVLIVRHRLGFVMANAGIDRSNVPGSARTEQVLLLPVDPDGSALRLRAALFSHLGVSLGVIISDSFGRPWRRGVVNVAIGAAGVPALLDRRGHLDREGRRLEVTEVAMADALASAAGLLMGEAAEGVPAVLVRGLRAPGPERPAQALLRPLDEDLFR